MTINDALITELAITIRRESEKLSLAEREGSYLRIMQSASLIEDAGRQIGWRALELEKQARYLAS